MLQMPGQAQTLEQLLRALHAHALAGACVDSWHFDILDRRQVRQQVITLENETEVIATQLCQLIIGKRTGFTPVDLVTAAVGVVQTAQHVHQR